MKGAKLSIKSITIFIFLTILLIALPVNLYAQIEDTTPPALADYTLDTPVIDTTSGPQTIQITVRVTDNLSGFTGDNVTFVVVSSSNVGFGSGFCSIIGGDSLNSTQQCTLTLPQFSELGIYEITTVNIIDEAGNGTQVQKAELETRGFPVEVLNAATSEDTTPPALADYTLDTPVIDTTSGPQTIQITVRVTDNLSGFTGDNVTFVVVSSSNVGFGSGFCSIIGGDSLNSTQQCTLTLPQFSELGIYEITTVNIIDEAGNGTQVQKAELETRGFPVEVLNAATSEDTTPPALADYTLDTPVIDTTSGPQTIQITVRVTDNLSGFTGDNVTFVVVSSSNVGFGSGFCSIIGGDSLNSTQQCTLTLPQFSELGIYEITTVNIIDEAGNGTQVQKAELETRGFPVEVLNAATDTDGDGIPDEEDGCPNSDLSETVIIDGCDSGVDNVLFDDGCTISDLIWQCAEDAKNHGHFVSEVSHTTNDLKKEGEISGKDKGKIQSCAASAAIP